MKPLLILLAVLTVLGAVGRMDFEDEMQEEAHYCEMVQSGAWPNFKQLECEQ
jgi:hypothetical protein